MNKMAVQAARRVVSHISTLKQVRPALQEFLLHERISAPIQGFCVTDFPLWKLAYLLDETWIEEDIMNALAELAYFIHAISLQNMTPTCLYLPTKFLSDARLLYHQDPRIYSPELATLWHRLISTRVDFIGFLHCKDSHYSAFTLDRSQPLLLHSDSLGYRAPGDVLPILQWVLSGMNYPFPTYVHEMVVPRQAASGAGSGSCGMAAHDFVLSHFTPGSGVSDPSSYRWTSSESPCLRDDALSDLVNFHHIASDNVIVCFLFQCRDL